MIQRNARVALVAVALALIAIVPPSAATIDPTSFAFGLELVADGFEQPVQVVDPGDGSGRLIVAEQTGRLRVVLDGQVNPTPFLDLSDHVSCCGERGLLSAAFHPEYAANGLVFVDYTDANGATVVAQYQSSPDDPNRLDASTGETVLTVDQPAANRNGGLLLFGPDGYLYAGLGDGRGGNSQNGQDLGALLGKSCASTWTTRKVGVPTPFRPTTPSSISRASGPKSGRTGCATPGA